MNARRAAGDQPLAQRRDDVEAEGADRRGGIVDTTFIPWLEGEPHDVPLDAVLTEDGVAWQRE